MPSSTVSAWYTVQSGYTYTPPPPGTIFPTQPSGPALVYFRGFGSAGNFNADGTKANCEAGSARLVPNSQGGVMRIATQNCSMQSNPDLYLPATMNLPVQESTAGTVKVDLGRWGSPPGPVDVRWAVSGTATLGVDYTIPGLTGNIGTTRVDGSSRWFSIPVTIIDDSIEDSGETIVLTLLDPGSAGYRLRGVDTNGNNRNRATVTIENRDPDACVDAGLFDKVRKYHRRAGKPRQRARWAAVLQAFGDDMGVTAMTAARARAFHDRGPAWREKWAGIPATIACLERVAAESGTAETAPTPVLLTLTGGDAVSEGNPAAFTVHAEPAPSTDLAVTLKVAVTGDMTALGAAGTKTVTVPMNQTSASYSVATVDDDADELDGSVTASLAAGGGYTLGASTSATVDVADDDEPDTSAGPVITVSGGDAVAEGNPAAFTVHAEPAPEADLTVKLRVAVSGDVTAEDAPGTKIVTVLAGRTSASYSVATVDDDAHEPDGRVTASVVEGEGYSLGKVTSATVSVTDDDEAPAGGATVSVADARADEGFLVQMKFAVTLSEPVAHPVQVYFYTRDSTPRSATAGKDYLGHPTMSKVTLRPGKTRENVLVLVLDDSHDEGEETFELVLARVESDGGDVTVGDGVAVGTIVNADPLPAAFLARFGRTVAEQALDGIAGRIAAPRNPGMRGTVAGQALSFDPAASDRTTGDAVSGTTPADRDTALAMTGIARSLGSGETDRFGAGFDDDGIGLPPGRSHAMQSRTMTAHEALLGSSFSLTGQTDGAGGSLAFWGRASQGSFDGAERGDGMDINLDGTVTTGMLGADYARDNWLVGLALTQSSAEGGYSSVDGANPCPEIEGAPHGLCDGAVRAGRGEVEASLTAAVPYGALSVSERLKLWGAAGFGTGEVTLKTAMGDSYSADTGWTMAAAGMRGDLLEAPKEGSGPALALTSDALWARTSSDKTRDLVATDSDVTRLRLGLEGSWRIAMEDGGSVIPKLELGARHDGGDAETGFGVEVGGGIAWNDPALGLSLDLSGRTLLAHEDDDLKDQGVSASLAFDPDPATKRGPSFALRQEFGGRAQGGLDALFASAPLEDRTGSEAASRWSMEAAYGFPVFGDRFTGSPHMGLGLATGQRDYSLGWRLTPEAASAPDLSFGVKAVRSESDTTEPEHTVGFEIRATW